MKNFVVLGLFSLMTLACSVNEETDWSGAQRQEAIQEERRHEMDENLRNQNLRPGPASDQAQPF